MSNFFDAYPAGLLGGSSTTSGIWTLLTKKFAQTTNTFVPVLLTNAGQVGPTGPSYSQCMSEYIGTSFANTLEVNYGYQTYTVARTGVYNFIIAGAAGGVWSSSPMSNTLALSAPSFGGVKRLPGAKITGRYFLEEGQKITVVVGQRGGDDDNTVANCPGGGGATMVTLGSFSQLQLAADTLLFVAGGGAGSGYQPADSPAENYLAGIGQSTTSGAQGAGTTGEVGGTGGNGAPTALSAGNSSGGAGYLTGTGLTTTANFTYTVPTASAAIGLRLGAIGASATAASRGYGGFGGGGHGSETATSDDDKGGGGGYSGGGYAYDAGAHGGGGGSFANAGAALVDIVAGGNTTNENGYVYFEYVSA